jgi:uncharacterized membrane protein
MDQSLTHAWGLAIAISTVAMLWNMLFNAAFDRAQEKMGFRRTMPVRALHALLFETGLTLAVVPLAAWWLDISFLSALILDIGLLVFFLFYGFIYNWCYDVIRARLMEKREATAPAASASAASASTAHREA